MLELLPVPGKEDRVYVGIYKKGNVYWMIKQYRGKKVEQSLDTSIKRMAEERYSKVVAEITDGSYFDFHFHDLPHTFATRLVQNGIDLCRVKELLGHKTISMTTRYAHHYPESLRSSIEVLEKNYYNSTTVGAQRV